jgi:hypothetical protein
MTPTTERKKPSLVTIFVALIAWMVVAMVFSMSVEVFWIGGVALCALIYFGTARGTL